MGGFLQVTSQVGQGSTFALTIPLAAPLQQRPQPQLPDILQSKRVAVIDAYNRGRIFCSSSFKPGAASLSYFLQ
ncbi:MAG: hypothetical protein HC886_13530 [Leptolyngbyaceae cyanobacterium SM1_1_3]|nr:hypothetical protein [Leptolyngbyaceae cyanobacterium SM1_1_3]